jgi:APA family basic amino acid/polyamine antiporter
MCFVRLHTWIAFIIWGALGIAVYFLYSKRRSNLENNDIIEEEFL